MVRIGRQMAQYDGDSSLQQERSAQPYRTEELPLPITGTAARAGQDAVAIWPQQMHPYTLGLMPGKAPIGVQADRVGVGCSGAHQQARQPMAGCCGIYYITF